VKCFCEESITFTTIWWFILAAGSAVRRELHPRRRSAGRDAARPDHGPGGEADDTGENSATLTAESGQSLAHPGGAGTYFWLGFVVGTAQHDAGDVRAPIGELDRLPNFGPRDGGGREALRLLDGERRDDARDVHAVGMSQDPPGSSRSARARHPRPEVTSAYGRPRAR
jgi:hypothetical protein